MDYLSFFLALSFIWVCFHFFISNILYPKSLPPGPRRIPVVGNIFDLGDNPHKTLTQLSKTFGPIMSLKLGNTTTVVISSPETAKEALNKHDQALSSRTVPDCACVFGHHEKSMVWLPTNSRWRNLRKISATQLFTLQKLDASQNLRQKKVQELLDYVQENCKSSQAINIGQAAFTTVLNLMSNTFFSFDLVSYSSNVSQEFYDLVVCALEEIAKPNIADYFPILRLIDPQGSRQRLKIYFERLMKIFDDIISKRMQLSNDSSKSNDEASRDVLDSLLMLVNETNSELSLADIKHLLLDLFVAGTDTTSTTLEWTMAELLRNPEKLAKVKNELKEIKGVVGESDIFRFPYLRAVVKETLRLHPPAPFLVPRKAEYDVEINGFRVPKNAKILVNVWAMGRDEGIWSNPNSFEPERFLDSKVDVKGRDFELIPFGAGRRICPGLPLANRMLHLMLASLIHSFDWKLAHGMAPNDMDMSETFGLSLHKIEPLLAVPSFH